MDIDTEVPDNYEMRVTTATPERTQERSDERALTVTAMLQGEVCRQKTVEASVFAIYLPQSSINLVNCGW